MMQPHTVTFDKLLNAANRNKALGGQPLSVTELAKRIGVSQATAYRAVQMTRASSPDTAAMLDRVTVKRAIAAEPAEPAAAGGPEPEPAVLIAGEPEPEAAPAAEEPEPEADMLEILGQVLRWLDRAEPADRARIIRAAASYHDVRGLLL